MTDSLAQLVYQLLLLRLKCFTLSLRKAVLKAAIQALAAASAVLIKVYVYAKIRF